LLPTWVAMPMILIMIEIHYNGTALLLLVNHAYCIEIIVMCAPLTYLLSEKKTLHCQLCSTHYEAVQINNCLKRTFAIKVGTMKITDNLHYEWKPSVPTTKLRWAKMNGREVHEKCIACTAVWQKASNSEKIKPVALVIVELRKSEGIRQVGS